MILKRQNKYKIHIIQGPKIENQSYKLEQMLATVIKENVLEIKKAKYACWNVVYHVPQKTTQEFNTKTQLNKTRF